MTFCFHDALLDIENRDISIGNMSANSMAPRVKFLRDCRVSYVYDSRDQGYKFITQVLMIRDSQKNEQRTQDLKSRDIRQGSHG